MPRCLRLHKVPPDTGFCAVCGARVLPGWVWLCLCALPLSLIYAAALNSRAAKLPVEAPPPIVETRIIVVTRLIEATRLIEMPLIITATESVPTPTHPLPTVAPSPTRTITPTPTLTRKPTAALSPTASPTPTRTPSPTVSPTPTATLNPRIVLLSFHGRYVTAKGEAYGWVLRQELKLDDKCGWFTVSPQPDGSVALLTCYNRYVTAPETGTDQADWLLRQGSELGRCGLFTVIDLGNDEFAFMTCIKTYFTAGDDNWPGGRQWAVIAETIELLDWEKFKLQPP